MQRLAIGMLLVGFLVASVAGDTIVKVYVNGKLQKYDPPARVRNGTAYVPLVQGAKSLGFTAEWLAEQNAVKICDDRGCLLIQKSEGITVNGRLLLPLRKMAQAFRAKVAWDPKQKAVLIHKSGLVNR